MADVAVLVFRPHSWIGGIGLPFAVWFTAACCYAYRRPAALPDPGIRERVEAALLDLCRDRSVPTPTLLMLSRRTCQSVKWSRRRSTLPVSEAPARQLDDRQLKAYLAHSLAHLSDPRLGETRWLYWAAIMVSGGTAGFFAIAYPLEVVGLFPVWFFLTFRTLGVPAARLHAEAELRADYRAVAELRTDGHDLIGAWRSLYSSAEGAKSRRWPPLRLFARLVTSSAGPPLDRRIAVINEAAGQR